MRQVPVRDRDDVGLGNPIVMNRKERRAAKKQDKSIASGAAADDVANLASKSAQLFDLAIERHQAGQLAEAERLCRQILALDARHADSLHLLGIIAAQTGRHETAADLIGQAIRLRADVPFYYNDLGSVLTERGRLDAAAASYRRALAINPDYAEAHYNLGIVLQGQRKFADAVASYQRALAIKPDFAEAHYNLGNAFKDQGRHVDAAVHYKHAVAIAPDFAEAHNNLGNALKEQGKLEDAAASCERAIAINPDFAEAYYNLANVLKDRGNLEAAAARYERALAINPDYADAYNNLGEILQDQGKFADAVASYERALAVKPDYADTYYNLANALKEQGKLEDAIARYEQAIGIKPDYAEAHNNLANVFSDQGKIEEAMARYERALAVKPDYALAHSNLILCMNYNSELPADSIDAQSRRWNERHALPHQPMEYAYGNDRNADRRLRIGYVSPDFRRHSVSCFLEPLLRAHDPAMVEVFCYAEVRNPDAVTDRLRALADCWRSTIGMTDDALAQRIREDRIDILIDLAGHTAGNRLPMFARKPAPVQVTWLGYPNTTGLTAIDYRLVDTVTDPEGDSEAWAREKLVRLQNGFLCYGPPADAPAPAPPPSLGSGVITFGSFNNLAKLSPATLDAWAAVLRLLPEARLLLKWRCFDDASTRALCHARFAERGIAPERIVLVGNAPDIVGHLAAYRRVDIALDPFPYNGTTTTCEALWMGVPVVTLQGRRHAGRVGSSLLGRLGLDDLIAGNTEEYIEIAAALAADKARLIRLRQDLRARVATSSLCDAPAFARQIEAAYREMWRRWCAMTPADARLSGEPSLASPANARKESSVVAESRSRRARIAEQVAAFPFWYHRIGLPEGVITPGRAPLDPTAYQIPARLEGKRVLDVGAWDGYWTFEALKRGAREVVAIDDFSDYMGTLEECDRKAWENFDLCRDLLGYDERRCQRIDMSVYDACEARLGRFDVVFFFGTLYHLRHPLLALDRLSAICDGEIFVESAVLDDFSPYRGGFGHGYPGGQRVLEFYPRDEYGRNHTNWFVPTVQCMVGLLEAAGFGDCRGWKLTDRPTELCYCRGFAHGHKVAA